MWNSHVIPTSQSLHIRSWCCVRDYFFSFDILRPSIKINVCDKYGDIWTWRSSSNRGFPPFMLLDPSIFVNQKQLLCETLRPLAQRTTSAPQDQCLWQIFRHLDFRITVRKTSCEILMSCQQVKVYIYEVGAVWEIIFSPLANSGPASKSTSVTNI